jgi:cyclin T
MSDPSSTTAPKVPILPSTFDENHLPSVLHTPDPMTPAAERTARRRTVRFIEEAGQRSLRLPRVAIATATVFFHRFYAKHSFQEHDRFEVAMACLLLAGKTEESPKKLDVVIRECWKLRKRAAQQQAQQRLSQGGESPSASSPSMASPTSAMEGSTSLDPKSEEYTRLKERVLLLERVILHTIGFELDISHPYKYLAECVQNLNMKRLLEYSSPPPPKPGSDGSRSSQNAQLFQDLFQYAMNFANDSMHTSLCLQFPSSKIAMACVYLSARYCNIRPSGNKLWMDLLELSVEELGCISLQILELCQPKRGVGDEVALKRIRRDLDALGACDDGEGGEKKRAKIG